jgi:hypothetical protein
LKPKSPQITRKVVEYPDISLEVNSIFYFERAKAVLGTIMKTHFEREKAFEVGAFEVGR